MNQTELNKYKAMLEAQAAELEAAMRRIEEASMERESPDQCASQRLNLGLSAAQIEELKHLAECEECDWTHQRASANYAIAILREITAAHKACGGPWALVYSILAMGSSYLILWSSKHFYVKLLMLLLLAFLIFVWMIHGAPPGLHRRKRIKVLQAPKGILPCLVAVGV